MMQNKLLYKKYIPVKFERNERNEVTVKYQNTGKWEDDFIHPGEFLAWGIEYEELQNGAGQYTVAIVKNPDGTVETVLPSNIKFITEDYLVESFLK